MKEIKSKAPATSILSTDFKYTHSHSTDIRATIQRAKAKIAAEKEAQESAKSTVISLGKKKSKGDK